MTPDEILLVQVGRGQPCALQTGTVLRAAPLHPGVPQPLPRHDRGHSRRSLLYDNGIIKLCQRSDRVIYSLSLFKGAFVYHPSLAPGSP